MDTAREVATKEPDPLFIEVAMALAQRWRVVAGVPAASVLVALVLVLQMHNRYTAVTTFVPETRGRAGATSALAGLAAAAGISLGVGEPGQSPQFYANLLRSTPIVYGVLQTRFAHIVSEGDGRSGDSVALVDYLQPGPEPLDSRLERAAKSLGSVTDIDVDPPTGIVRLKVTAPRPALAAAIANEYVHQLNLFNRDSRQSQARSRRVFAAARAAEAAGTLAAAEEALRVFYERNRQFTASPGLRFEEGRLRRQLDIQQELYLSMSREAEMARISEADETPVITVIEPALVPTRKSAPNRKRTLLGVAVATLCLTISWVVFFELQRDQLRTGLATLQARMRPLLPRPFGRVPRA